MRFGTSWKTVSRQIALVEKERFIDQGFCHRLRRRQCVKLKSNASKEANFPDVSVGLSVSTSTSPLPSFLFSCTRQAKRFPALRCHWIVGASSACCVVTGALLPRCSSAQYLVSPVCFPPRLCSLRAFNGSSLVHDEIAVVFVVFPSPVHWYEPKAFIQGSMLQVCIYALRLDRWQYFPLRAGSSLHPLSAGCLSKMSFAVVLTRGWFWTGLCCGLKWILVS